MSCYRTFVLSLLAGALALTLPSRLQAQSDAEIALQTARAALEAEQFEDARDQARKASQTDAKNPDVWLLLGRAHFQLGELNDALNAWQTLLKLAPNHEYGRRMVAALEGQTANADTRLRFIATLVSEGMTSTASAQLKSLQTRSTLTDSQRQQAWLLQAEIAVLDGKGTDSLAAINELTSHYPEAADELSTRLLAARAQLAIGGDFTAIGMGELRKISEEGKDVAEGRLAELELKLYSLAHGSNVVAEVADWVEKNPALPACRRARVGIRESVHGFLARSRTKGPKPDAVLNENDLAALAAAAHAARVFVDPADQVALAKMLTEHFQKWYVGIHAYKAARSAVAKIEEMNLPVSAMKVVTAFSERIDEAEATKEYSRIKVDIANTHLNPDVLAEWIANHVGHPQELEARDRLVYAYLNVVRRQAAPASDAQLSETDQKVLTAAGELIAKTKNVPDILKLVQHLRQHFQEHYFDRGARSAGIAGIEALIPLEVTGHRVLLAHALLDMRRQVAIADLQTAVAAGKIPSGVAAMPASLNKAADTAFQISTDYPARPAWAAQADLANQVLDTAGKVAWPTKIESPKAAHVWALNLAIPVVKANADAKAVTKARAVVDRVVNDLTAVTQQSAAGLASENHALLLATLDRNSDLWVDVALRHIDLLSADAARAFDNNLRSGEGAKNKKLTDTQTEILTLLSGIVKQRPSAAETCLQKLGAHLQKWSAARHDAIVESAYETFAADLPPTTQRRTRLALATLWFNQVLRAHSQTMTNGFVVARELDAASKKSLEECYRLAGLLGPGDPLLADVRALRMKIIDHYLALEYEEVAEAAIKVKVDPGSLDLDESAELELAGLKRRLAERQLEKLLQQHDGKKQVVLTPAFNEAIAALKKFITDHPGSERLPSAAEGILVIGRRFEQHQAWTIAAEIYADFEQFAAKIDSLTQTSPGQSTWPERCALARAQALHSRASSHLQEWNTSKPDDALPPAELSDEFQQAQAAWQKIIADYQQRPVAQTAISRVMGIAQEYAGLGAWDVADSTYASLLNLKLPLRSPERLEFARAICQLGKVLPDHSRTVLAALAVTGSQVGADEQSSERLTSDQLLGAVASLDLEGDLPVSESSTRATANRPGSRQPAAPQASAPAPQIATGGALAPFGNVAGRAGSGDDSADGSGQASAGFGGGGVALERRFRAKSDAQLMAALRTQLDRQAQQVAMLRDNTIWHRRVAANATAAERDRVAQKPGEQTAQSTAVAVLSEAELLRQQKVIDAVYEALQALRQKHPDSPTAEQARDTVFIVVNHWRAIAQWDRAAKLARRFLTDNPTDIKLPTIRQEIARDWLAWASLGVKDPELDREELLGEIASRFDTARTELQAIIDAFPDETAVRHQAQWDIANSFLTQARVVASSSPTLARGQFVRAATELLRVSELFHDHPQISTIPDILWGISNELAGRSYHDEAITVWNELRIHYPTHGHADQAALRIAQTWQQLGQPLRAVEAFLELNFARGGNDASLHNTIYQIATSLKTQKRWIESLHVLQTFVDSFPAHQNAGQALTMIGEIHQANEVWEDAIVAYGRVIDEFPTGAWTTEARWSIAECTINLSLWQEAMGAYAEFQKSYPKDGRVAEAARRIEVLKTLSRYQDVIDEPGQRKAFDAQFQMATIVHTQLTNPVKAVIEYRKVARNWPNSHLADDALFEIGKIYLDRGETELARTALIEAAKMYPKSPLADDALLLVGQSFVAEADQLASVDRSKSQAIAKDIAQRRAYVDARDNLRRQLERNLDQIAQLKKAGKREEAANKEAYFAGQALQFDAANTLNFANRAAQQEEVLSAEQLADRQDKINASLRRAVDSFRQAASVVGADKADDALLQMAQIYDERLKDSVAAMSTWEEIVKQYSGTAVAEDASWKMASYYENEGEHSKAIAAYQTFFRNYRRSPRAGQAQAAIAENHEHLGEWVQAMDAYTNYLNNFPEGPLAKKAKDQINWIKTYRL